MKKRIHVVALICVLSAVFLAGCSSSKYKEAKALMDNGSYSEAAEIFATITNYNDSEELYKSCMYNKGKALIDAGTLSEAADVFSAIIDYKDSKELYSSCIYSQGQKYIRENNYTEAQMCFEKISDYKDASDMAQECGHIIDVKNDKTAPNIIGITEGEVLEIQFNEEYNLKDYLNKNVSVTDDVSGEITDYKINTESTIYDPDNGKIDTKKDGTFSFSLVAADEAENKASVNFSVHIDALLRITADTEFPLVMYDGELGKYTLESIIHYKDWMDAPGLSEGYYFTIEVYNGYEETVDSYFGRAYINDYRTPVYHKTTFTVAPGKKGLQSSYIEDEDLDEHTKDFEQIEIEFAVENEKDDEELFVRPVVVDKDAIIFK